MVSPIESIPFVETVASLEAGDEAKDSLLRSVQLAVREIHVLASKASPQFVLNGELQEVHFLCERLDKVFLYGLKQLQWGYWPFVQEFCHRNTQDYLKTLELVTSSLGKSRAWLFHSLNECILEAYIRSFLQNPKIVHKFYMQPALFRDEQRTQLLVTILAGLEFVPFQLELNVLSLDRPEFLSSTRINKIHVTASSWSLDKDSEGTVPSSSSLESFQEIDVGVVCLQNGVEVACERDVVEAQQAEVDNNATLKETPPEVRIRLQHSIDKDSLNSDDTTSDTTDVEVIRTRVVRRRKKVTYVTGNGDKLSNNTQMQEELGEKWENREEENQNICNRYSRDSGMCCDISNPEMEDDLEQQRNKSNILLENDASLDLELLRCTEALNVNSGVTKKVKNSLSPVWMEERGAPEGEEAPHSKHQNQENSCSSSLIQLESPNSEDSEISIYDSGKASSNMIDNVKKSSSVYWGFQGNNLEMNEAETPKISPIEGEKCDCTEIFQNHLIKMKRSDEVSGSQSDLRLHNNTLLFLMLEVFEDEDEVFYKMFLTATEFVEGHGQHIFLLLTSKCLYVLQPGISVYKFHKLLHFTYSELDCVLLFLNYQGFLLISQDRIKKFPVWTASEHLTRSIISSLELAVRGSKSCALPCVPTDCIGQITMLKKALSAEIKCEVADLEIHHYVLTYWDNHKRGHSSPGTLGGPRRSGFLMYRTKRGRNRIPNSWKPAYFVLKAGVLYCFDQEGVTEPKFFIHLRFPYCGGCRRLPLEDKPHLFELILPNWDSLQMAASDDNEASDWLQDFLHTVSLADRILEVDPPLPYQCCLVLAGDFMFTILENNHGGEVKAVLGKTNITDILTLSTDEEMPNYCILEFDCTEVDNCSGEWIFYFVTEHEQNKFVDVVSGLWENLFKIPLARSVSKDLSLRRKCQERWSCTCQSKEVLEKLCLDS
ncbi:pleckstrin homology domain-containing family M member 2-like isoform X1 [Tachypleus tridentatus]|uniref:pleckstrin homology domain-containing family M member 2-like isoform X1 n=1 Tax=Tachypleus tridentatus TaxID=6853 RepID=UPI003FD4564F